MPTNEVATDSLTKGLVASADQGRPEVDRRLDVAATLVKLAFVP